MKFLLCGKTQQSAIGRSPCGERGLKCARGRNLAIVAVSLPVRGAWIEISTALSTVGTNRRSPCGERGLKCLIAAAVLLAVSRSPCGERGLKWRATGCNCRKSRRSPCGERGLKSLAGALSGIRPVVAPRAGSVD